MTINNDTNAAGLSQLDLDRTNGARPVSSGNGSSAVPSSSAQGNDSIALTQTGDLVQLALETGASTRSARIEQLKNLVETNQYQVDAGAVSSALIEAHLTGA